MPSDEKYFWARENVGTRGLTEEEYKSKANNQALKTISMQIRITVSGQARSSFSETMDETDATFQEIFEQESSTSTIADIQGAEKYDEHTTATTYWVIWRLDKDLHEKNMENFVEAAKNQYEGFLYWNPTAKDAVVNRLKDNVKMLTAYNMIGDRTDFKGQSMLRYRVASEDPMCAPNGNFYHYYWQS